MKRMRSFGRRALLHMLTRSFSSQEQRRSRGQTGRGADLVPTSRMTHTSPGLGDPGATQQWSRSCM